MSAMHGGIDLSWGMLKNKSDGAMPPEALAAWKVYLE